jgi:hypothetical protein
MDVPEEQKQQVRQLLKEGKRIMAIKYLTENFGLGLKDAKRMADLIQQDIIDDGEAIGSIKDRTLPNMKGCFIGKLFKIISLIFLGIGVYFFIDDYQLVSAGIQASAVVVSNPNKPIFEYEVAGEKYTYEASVSSTPPSYFIGEEVDIYVNPDDPYEILIDTFTDRWLVVVIFGSMGLVFLLIGIVTSKLLGRLGTVFQK